MKLSKPEKSSAKEKIPLSIIIPTFGRNKDLEGLLTSVKSDKETHEIIVVDDCSHNPEEFDFIKKIFPDVRFLHLKKNIGPGQARNEGAKIARGEIILFLDSDTELIQGAISLLINYSRNNPDIKIFSGWDSPIPLNSGFFPRFKALFMVVGAPKVDADVSFIAGRCFAIKREIMLESGGFKDKYKGADVEDFEFGYRLRRRYGKIRYLSGLRVHHRYPSIWKQFKLYFKRIRMWISLKGSMGGFDDSFGTTQKDAIIQLLSAVWPPVFMLSLTLGYFLLGPAFLFTALWVNRNFLALCLREEGVLFTIISICCHSFLAMAVLAGALFELAQKPRLLFRIVYRGSQ